MLHIVIGYTEKGSQAEPVPLYVGRDSTAADALSLNPPAGILRTELSKNPIVHRRRVFDPVVQSPAPLVLEAEPAAAPEAPAEEKPKASTKAK